MSGGLGDAAGKVASLALTLGSGAADATSFVADLGEELPFISPVLKTLTAIREKVETVKRNREELKELEQRCAYVTACVVVTFKENVGSQMDVTPLEDCLKDVGGLIERCSRRRRFSRIFNASSEKGDIAQLNVRIDRLAGDLGLASNAILERKIDELDTKLESMGNGRRSIVKLAKVPKGTPVRKSWHIERQSVTDTVLKALTADGGQRLVGLVGDSGSGKTTATSEIVRRDEVRETFCNGIVWLSVHEGANQRLPVLMMELAKMVYEDVDGRLGRRPAESEDGAAYIKQRMAAGEGSKCLVVADNVWEEEVVSKLLETGMWVLLSTRHEELVTGADGEAVGVDELSEADAESVLRRASELPSEVHLPDDAVLLVELCGHVVMDLAFVGRWSTVRCRQDRKAWSGATERIRAEMSEVGCDPGNDTAEDTRSKRREAILRAGFEDLVVGTDDERVQRLYLSLAVLPDGRAFSVGDAAVLLYDGAPSPEDEASVARVVGVLERWSILRSTGRAYRMHDAHSSFAMKRLLDRGDVRRPALQRWVEYVSSLDALRSIDRYALKDLWLAIERVGGDGWDKTRPYVKALAKMDDSDSLLREAIQNTVEFQEVQEDWEGASTTWRQLMDAEKRELGADHPFVVNNYQRLADCADRLGKAEEAAQWREKELEELPLALARMKLQADSVGFGQREDLGGVLVLHSERWKLEPDDRAVVEKLLRRCLSIQEAKLGPEDVQVAHTLYQLGVCVREAGQLDEAEDLLRRCLSIEGAKQDPEDVRVAYTLHELAICVREAGRLDEAEDLLRRCLLIEEARLGPEDLQVAYTLYQLGMCVREAGRPEEAEQLLRRCLSIEEARLGPEDMQVAQKLYQLGLCVREAGRLEEAEQLLRRCLSTEEARLGPEDMRVAQTLYQLGLCVRQAGRLDEAEELWRRCLLIEEARLGPEDVRLAQTLYQLGICVREAGRLDEAEELLRRCLSIEEAKQDPEDVRVAYTLHELAICFRKAGRLDEAQQLLRRCLWIEEVKLGPEDVQVAYTLSQLGLCLRQAGRMEDAEESLRRCLSIEEARLGPEDMREAQTLYQLGLCVRQAGRLDEAEQLLRRCLSIEEAKLGPEDVEVAYTLFQLGICVRVAGRLKEAEELLRRSSSIREAKLGPEGVQVA